MKASAKVTYVDETIQLFKKKWYVDYVINIGTDMKPEYDIVSEGFINHEEAISRIKELKRLENVNG